MTGSALDSLLNAPWHRFTTLDSTNDFLMTIPSHERVAGTTCSSDVQQRGKGRNDRIWFSPSGGLYLSILLRPALPVAQWATLSLAIAVACSDTLNAIDGNLQVTHKWPNDLLIRGKKVGGILIQCRHDANPFTVVGIGINIEIHRADLPHRLLFPATSLHDEAQFKHSISEIAELLRRYVLLTFLQWEESVEAILVRWMQRSATSGKMIEISTGTEQITGVDQGIDDVGNLIIQHSGGHRTVRVADIIRIDHV